MKSTITLTHPPVEVYARDFFDAVSKLPKMKRGPMGAQGRIPSDTILAPYDHGIMVETSVMATSVTADTPWRVRVSVVAVRLVKVCETLKRLGAAKEQDAKLAISVVSGEVKIRYRTTTVGIAII